MHMYEFHVQDISEFRMFALIRVTAFPLSNNKNDENTCIGRKPNVGENM